MTILSLILLLNLVIRDSVNFSEPRGTPSIIYHYFVHLDHFMA
jgi:hypothetical protein